MTSPSWCNCHLDTKPRHCRVCAPERKPTRKRAVAPRMRKRKEPRGCNDCGEPAVWFYPGERRNWYPQMGGYTCHSWTRIAPEVEGCFEAYVWHDGSFPFDDDREPGCVHHCSPRQFIDYGEDVLAAQRELVERGSDG